MIIIKKMIIKNIIGIIIDIYLNNYILSKINLYFCFYIWGFATAVRAYSTPTSFVATYGVRLTKCAYDRREAISSTSSDTLRERLYLNLNVINYFTCKTILVLFSTNFILALSPQAYFVWFLAKPACGVRREKEQ